MTSTITGTPSSQPNKYLLITILLWLTGACRIGDPTHVLPGTVSARTVVCVESNT